MADFKYNIGKDSWSAKIATKMSGKVGTEDLILEMKVFQLNPELVSMPHIRA